MLQVNWRTVAFLYAPGFTLHAGGSDHLSKEVVQLKLLHLLQFREGDAPAEP